MRRLLILLALPVLAHCAPTVLVPRPAEGYRAIRVAETQRFEFSIGYFEVTAGMVYAADRLRSDGEQLWCAAGAVPPMDCVLWDGAALTLRADGTFPVGPYPVLPGSIEEFRLR
jgi:hypothetical protein